MVVEHVDAGPPEPIPKDAIYPYVGVMSWELRNAWSSRRPDIVHGHFWMSGLASVAAARPLRVPVVQTFHALGAVKRRHQGDKDTSPPGRLAVEEALMRRVDKIV